MGEQMVTMEEQRDNWEEIAKFHLKNEDYYRREWTKLKGELKIEQAKVARLEAMVSAQDEVIRDERQAHEAQIARMSGELDDARHEVLMMTMDMEGAE